MRVLHIISGGLSGGAARGALWLHQALKDFTDVDSRLLHSGTEQSQSPSVQSVRSFAGLRAKKAVVRARVKARFPQKAVRAGHLFSTPKEGLNIQELPGFDEAEILHLHWISGLINIRSLQTVRIPIVWTLRDMWPFTGGCHYALECTGYQERCETCPVIASSKYQGAAVDGLTLKETHLPKDLVAVAPSEWMRNRAKLSRIFRDRRVELIPNVVDLGAFRSIEEDRARQILGISSPRPLVAVGGLGSEQLYKGLDRVPAILRAFRSDEFDLLLFGQLGSQSLPTLRHSMWDIGQLTSSDELSALYSAASMLLFPSRQESFGKTVVEALACGTPVVCFKEGAQAEHITHLRDGYLARDLADFQDGISWALEKGRSSLNKTGAGRRDSLRNRYGAEAAAGAHLKLYRELIT